MRWIAVAGPLILWLVWELHRFRQRRLVIRRSQGKTPPYSWPVRADVYPEIYEAHELAAVSRLLHRRYHRESQHLDVIGTVSASIAALGFPTLRYRRDSRLPEYLMLIDRVSFRDHQSHLYEHLATMLRAHGLHVDVWFFEGDPRVCWSQTGDDSVYLEYLQHTYQSHRLLLFGTGEQLLDAVTGLLASWHRIFEGWTDRAILTPEPISRWRARELTLATQFAVVPATLEGLAILAAYFELPLSIGRRPLGGEGTSDASLAAAEIDAIRRYLGADVFQWLCACAIYPELQWSLTLCLGALPAMAPGLVCEENLAKLLRLEWFRVGSIPDDRRRELIAHLDAHIERAVREAIVGVLEHSPSLDGTFAASAHQFQIAYQRSRLAPKDRKVRSALRAALRNLPPGEIVNDYAFLDAAESVSRSPLQLVLPGRLRRLFYPAWMPWMGMRSAARLMLTLAVATAILAGLRAADERIQRTSADEITVMAPPTPVAAEPPPKPTAPSAPETKAPTDQELRKQELDRNRDSIVLIGQTARKQLRSGQREQALNTVVEGLPLEERGGGELHGILDSLLDDAQRRADRARNAARTAGAVTHAQSTFAEGLKLEKEATQHRAADEKDQATRSLWRAADRFEAASREAQPAEVDARQTQLAAAEPPKPQVDVQLEQGRIKDVLRQYEQGYDTLNAPLVKRVFPNVRDDLPRIFAEFEYYRLEMIIQDISVAADGMSATASCRLMHLYKPKIAARPEQRSEPQQFNFRKQSGNTWLIVALAR